MKITALFVFVFLLFSAMPAFASQFQPISEITDFEKGIISNAAKKPTNRILKDAVEFRVNRNLVVLKFKNGDDGYYSYGDKKGIAIESNSSEKKQIMEACETNLGLPFCTDYAKPNDPTTSSPVIPNPTANIMHKINTIIGNRFSNELTPEKLYEVENLMQEYLAAIQQNPNLLERNDAFSLGRLGNKYISQVEPILSFAPLESTVWFYDGYIATFHMEKEYLPAPAEVEDLPTELDVLFVIPKLIDAFTKLTDYTFLTSGTEIAIEKLNPEAYQLLIASGKIKRYM